MVKEGKGYRYCTSTVSSINKKKTERFVVSQLVWLRIVIFSQLLVARNKKVSVTTHVLGHYYFIFPYNNLIIIIIMFVTTCSTIFPRCFLKHALTFAAILMTSLTVRGQRRYSSQHKLLAFNMST